MSIAAAPTVFFETPLSSQIRQTPATSPWFVRETPAGCGGWIAGDRSSNESPAGLDPLPSSPLLFLPGGHFRRDAAHLLTRSPRWRSALYRAPGRGLNQKRAKKKS